VPRQIQDEYAVLSHHRAEKAWAEGRIADQNLPVAREQRDRSASCRLNVIE
jgi:acetyl-CoA acetyltransferase